MERTWSAKAGRIEAPKDHEGRHVKASPALLAVLRAHLEAVALEGQIQDWNAEQRALVFANKAGPDHSVQHLPRGRLAALAG